MQSIPFKNINIGHILNSKAQVINEKFNIEVLQVDKG